jgi:DNA replication protein DnaC
MQVRNNQNHRLSGTRVRITILAALNQPFGEWNQIFPNAGCVVTLVDRLMHKAEILTLAGKSYRLKEAQERAARNAKSRAEKKTKKA